MNDTPSPTRTALVAEEDMLPIHDRPLYYRRLRPRRNASDGKPTLVFLHEALGCTAMWHDFPARVAAATGLTVVSFDRAGYGRSAGNPRRRGQGYLRHEAESVLPLLLEQLDIDRAVLVGHSDGGSIALLAAACLPHKIIGVITEAAHVFVEEITLEGIRAAVSAYGPRHLEARLSRYHGAKTRSLFFAWADTWLAASFRDWNIEDCLPRIRCPALIIQGQDDPYGSERQVRAIVAGIGPHARPLLLPDCGHAPHRDAEERTCAAIAAFVTPLGQKAANSTRSPKRSIR